MSEHLTPVVIVGARGRMGRVLIREVTGSDNFVLVGAVDRSGGPGRGLDAGRLAGTVDIGVTVTDELIPRRSVVVDFSLPQATVGNIRRCVDVKPGHRMIGVSLALCRGRTVLVADTAVIDLGGDATEGEQLVARIRRSPGHRNMFVVATGVPGTRARGAALHAGADLYVDKPLALREIFRTLEILIASGGRNAPAA